MIRSVVFTDAGVYTCTIGQFSEGDPATVNVTITMNTRMCVLCVCVYCVVCVCVCMCLSVCLWPSISQQIHCYYNY